MKLRFLATGKGGPYSIDGETIDGIDFSIVEHGGQVLDTTELREAGVRGAWRDESGELYVVLCQEVPRTVELHGRKYPQGDWRGSGQWIDADSYDPETLYIQQVNA